jgi:hypothetical protein
MVAIFIDIDIYCEFTLNLFTIIVGFFDIKAWGFQEVFPTKVRSLKTWSEDKQYLSILLVLVSSINVPTSAELESSIFRNLGNSQTTRIAIIASIKSISM